ncbi:MAG TPA: hypothetical protein VMV26_13995 [Alphaproteobacteria bacterium]|jgi:hypothetical protein|nr:hypothetical protein [Alphaproteobacteria bacterium]
MLALSSRRAFIGRTAGMAAVPLLSGATAHAQFAGGPKMIASPYPSFVKALLADRPAADRADRMQLYAFLIGRWDMEGVVHRDDGTENRNRGSIHAGWVLEGRALQDVWTFPGSFYGTTLRVYDPALAAWHILWSDPLKQLYLHQLGRAQGPDIVQEGKVGDSVFTRWRFTERTPNAFHWLGERSTDGATWQLQAEFFARRAAA